MAAAVRPATVPDDHFAVRFSGTLLTRPGQWSAPLVAGAGYGLTDNFEIGTALLRFTLAEAESGVPGADGLTAPTIYGAARLPLGPVELGGRAELELPLEGFRALSAGTFVRFHFGSVARVDLSAEATLFYDGVEVSWPSVGDLGATFNLLERWALTGGLSFRSDDLGADLRAVPRVGTLVTLGQPSSPPLLDLEVALLFPAAALTGPDFEEGWGGSLILTLFFDDPADGVGPDPF
ncbi:MAG: hypothetical protein AAFU79_25050 [Myxococcota bacterium]